MTVMTATRPLLSLHKLDLPDSRTNTDAHNAFSCTPRWITPAVLDIQGRASDPVPFWLFPMFPRLPRPKRRLAARFALMPLCTVEVHGARSSARAKVGRTCHWRVDGRRTDRPRHSHESIFEPQTRLWATKANSSSGGGTTPVKRSSCRTFGIPTFRN